MAKQSQSSTPCHGSLAHRPEIKKETLTRIHAVSGHISAVGRMIQEERLCLDILRQIAAVQASLSQISLLLARSHFESRWASAIQAGRSDEPLEEVMEIFKYLKS